MERDESGGEDPYVEARLPRELHDRVERLFREYRGYDAASVQESLSVVCDLAERQLAAEESDITNQSSSTARTDTSGTGPEQTTETTAPSDDSPGAVRAAVDEVFPTDWDATERTAERLPLIVSHYLTAEGTTRVERENSALSAAAARTGTTPERLRTEVVDDVYGTDTLPGDLASEFFSEALGKVEQRLDRAEADVLSAVELVSEDAESDGEPGSVEPAEPATPSLDLGGGSDLPKALADDVASDGGAVQSVDDRIDSLFAGPNGLTEIGIESLVDGAATDCEVCGERYSVVDLQTTTEASDDRRVNLVCEDCAPE